MVRGQVDIASSEVILLESFPVQVRLNLKGALPTPCHQLRAEVSGPDDQKRIDVEVYSLVDPEEVCVQMLEPFETSINLGSFPSGTYSVWVNGEEVGDITV
jgi:inhibitor of cysteine peptidase